MTTSRSSVLRRSLALLALAVACTACSRPEPPKKNQPPEPQAADLRDRIHRPIDRAKAAEDDVLDAAQKQRDAIDAQTGG